MIELPPNFDREAQLLDLDRADCEEDLYTFLKAAWRYIDPALWKDAWCVQAICEHLQAVVDGQIKRLIINCPPRIGKSNTVSVAFPAWTWAQPNSTSTCGAGVPFLYASYADKLSLRDSVKCRRLIESPWYQKMWGDRFQLTTDQNTKSRFTNNKGGDRLITSIGAGVTGEGGNIICFPGDEIVATERGYITIGEIVKQRMNIRVWSFNLETQKPELRRISGWFRNPASDIVRVGLSDGATFRCTPDHHVWTHCGYVKSRDLTSLHVLPRFSALGEADSGERSAVPSGISLKSFLASADVSNGVLIELCIRMMHAASAIILFYSRVVCRYPTLSSADVLDGSVANAIFFRQCGRIFGAIENVIDGLLIEQRHSIFLSASRNAVTDGVRGILQRGSVAEIFEIVIAAIAVKVAHLIPGSTSRASRAFTDKCATNSYMSILREILAVAPQIVESITSIDAPFQNPALAPWDMADTSPVIGDIVIREIGERAPLFVKPVGHEAETFCLEVEGNHNFYVGYGTTLVSNCIDDPNAANDVESEATTEATITWWTTAMPTRLNDPENGAFIIIQQRLGEDDLTGHILEHEADGWTHLCLPGRYEPERSFHTVIGWKDPRTEPNQLLWPERFSEEYLQRLEKSMGPYTFAGQIQQRPEPKGGGIIKREWWKLWESNSYPPMDFVLATLDGAYTEDRMNDPSGMIVWGLFSRKTDAPTPVTNLSGADGDRHRIRQGYSEFAPHVLCMYAWTSRLELHDLVEKVAQTCIKLKVDLLLIENKASGISVSQEIRRLYWRELFGVELFDPKSQDKAARLYSVQHLFAEGIIFGPDRPWMEQVITQVAAFPKAKHDEFVDLTSMGLRKLRDMGLLVRQPEREADNESQKIYPRGQDQPLYPV